MAQTLSIYPQWCTTKELRRDIGCGKVVMRAVGQLERIGLLERRKTAIRATEPVAHLERLDLP